MNVEGIQSELDECFEAMGCKNDVFPFTHGWREDGVPASMVLKFCEMQAAKGRPLKCWIFHAGQKIAEYIPANATSDTPSITFAVFGDHAASMMEAKACQVRDEYTQRNVRRIYEPEECPPFDEWYDEITFLNGLEDGFQTFAEKLTEKLVGDGNAKRRRSTNSTKRGPGSLWFFGRQTSNSRSNARYTPRQSSREPSGALALSAGMGRLLTTW
jgi:hypothetical protein